MKKFIRVSVLVISLLMACSMPSQARGGGRGGWGLGPALGFGLFGLGLLEISRPYYSYPYYYPAAVVQQPVQEIYMQPASRQPPTAGYWYFCQNPEGYYPYVKQCPDGWMKVVPSPPPPPQP